MEDLCDADEHALRSFACCSSDDLSLFEMACAKGSLVVLESLESGRRGDDPRS